jgi:hypothetical protein
MSEGKKLNIEYSKLVEIARALNENTVANKSRDKENKISNDKFIRTKFNISRKNFTATIKDTDISYNVSTHLYDIGNAKNIILSNQFNKEHNHKNNTNILDNDIQKKLMEIIKWYETKEDNSMNNSSLNVDMNKLKGEIQTTTVRLHSNVWSDFRKFTKRYKKYKSMDLVSMALVEYMEKYQQ